MGSDSDLGVMRGALEALGMLGVAWEAHVASAHRTPERVRELAATARQRGVGVVIAGAGGAAHLAGVVAAHTTLPVVAVPIAGGLGGLDALLAEVQMPRGVPVATVAVDGAFNAGLLAAEILAVADADLAARLDAYRARLADEVRAKDERLGAALAGEAAPA
ncbi:MAG: 5-(carboxyamino)imidazole ribonucleotide mutase [Firmicutes bacterium]|nr:5-(carboxyamino)imidazole ribonucleotide mutase [Bacillota bacterium]